MTGIPSRQADHFIMKDTIIDGKVVVISDLLSFIEDVDLSEKDESRSVVESKNIIEGNEWTI
jgi:predicted aconitase with swiveling domain